MPTDVFVYLPTHATEVDKRILDNMTQHLLTNTQLELTVASAVSAVSHVDGVTFLHAGTGRLFASNHVAARVWDALHRHLWPCEIAEEIACEYGLPPSAARKHVDAFLTELVRHQLIEPEISR